MVSQAENFFIDICDTEKQEKAEILGSCGSSEGQDVAMGTMKMLYQNVDGHTCIFSQC